MQTKFTLLFLLATWVSNAQYQIFFKDQFLVSTNEIKQDSLGVHYKQGGVEKIAAYKDLYAIKGQEESFFFRGRYARRTRQYQPDFYDLSKDFSVGVNMVNLFKNQLEVLASYYLDAQREYETNLKLRIGYGYPENIKSNRYFKNSVAIDLRKYITLKRRIRFSYGLGAGLGTYAFNHDNKSHDIHPFQFKSEIDRLESKESRSENEERKLRLAKEGYEIAMENVNHSRTYTVYGQFRIRAMMSERVSLNMGIDLGVIWGDFQEAINYSYYNIHPYKYSEVYFNPTIGINYHFNIK